MTDLTRELGELRREIVEARNQAIKTDNQVKNLSLDVKGFERRFDIAEKRARIATLGVHVVVALTIAFAAYVLHSVKARQYEETIANLRADVETERQNAQTRTEELRTRVAQLEKDSKQLAQAEQLGLQIIDKLDANQDNEAGEILQKLDITRLSPLGKRLADKRFVELRQKTHENVYKQARNLYNAGKYDEAVNELRRALALAPDGRASGAARYLLGSAFWNQKNYTEAEPLFREVLKNETDRTIIEEVRYLLATALTRLGRKDDAKTFLQEIILGGGKFSGAAKAYLQALESGSELPTDLPGGRIARTDVPGPQESTPQ